ncbi:hypothetical protein [Nitratireductor sp. XY-223]|uniref:hypothetical protein n=1 Tax=Nitratireductor sp. XY-223 TaxID=2561926 RepID=UPI00197E732A|nr:hypothetical protein [Nitratireductor sp. XY-223]
MTAVEVRDIDVSAPTEITDFTTGAKIRLTKSEGETTVTDIEISQSGENTSIYLAKFF